MDLEVPSAPSRIFRRSYLTVRRPKDIIMTIMRCACVVLLGGGLAGGLADSLAGAEGDSKVASDWIYAGLLTGTHMPSADFSDSDGSMATNEYVYEARAFWDVRQGTMMAFSVGGGVWNYNSPPLRDAYHLEETMRGNRVRFGGMQMLGQHWAVMLQEALGYEYDGRAALREGLQSWTYAGPVWVRDRDLFIAVGAYVNTRLTGGVTVLPLPTMHWQVNPNWLVKVFDQVDTNSRVTYTVNDRWSAGLRLDIQSYQSALAHDTATQAAVLEDKRAQLGAECDWTPWIHGLVLRPFAGVVFGRQITLRTEDGDQVFDDRTKPAPVLGLSLYGEF